MNTEQERADFEAWANTQADKWLIVGGLTWSPGTNDYASARTNAAWAAWQAGRAALQSQDREDAERYRWLKANGSMAVESFAGKYRVVDAGVSLVITDWLDSFDEAIDHARRAEGGNHE